MLKRGTEVEVIVSDGKTVTGTLTADYDRLDCERWDVRLAPATIVYSYHVQSVSEIASR